MVSKKFILFDSDVIVFVVHSPGHYALWLACNTQVALKMAKDPKFKSPKQPFLASLDSMQKPGIQYKPRENHHIIYAILNTACFIAENQTTSHQAPVEMESQFHMKSSPPIRIRGPPVQNPGDNNCGPFTLLYYLGLM